MHPLSPGGNHVTSWSSHVPGTSWTRGSRACRESTSIAPAPAALACDAKAQTLQIVTSGAIIVLGFQRSCARAESCCCSFSPPCVFSLDDEVRTRGSSPRHPRLARINVGHACALERILSRCLTPTWCTSHLSSHRSPCKHAPTSRVFNLT